MRLFLRKELLEDTQKVEGLREKLLEALNKREEFKRDIVIIANERNKRQRDVEDREGIMWQFHRNFKLLPEDQAPLPSDFSYWRGVDSYHALEAAKTSLRQWEEAELPKIPGLEAQITELDAEIESLRTELGGYVSIEVEELQGLVFDPQNKRYRLSE